MQTTKINYLPYVLTFDGKDDHIVLPEMNVDYSHGFTLEAWVYYNSFKPWAPIIDFCQQTSDKAKIIFANLATTDTLILDIKNNGTEQRITAEKALETHQWIHLAATVDAAGNGKLYKNGQEIQSGKIHLPENIVRNDNYIGGRNHGCKNGFFDGRMSEIRLWNRVRLVEEMRKDMHCRLVGDEAGLVGYWPLNEGYGETVREEGKVKGAAWQQEIFFPVETPLSYPQPILCFHGLPDYVEIKDPFANDKEFTISLWVKPKLLNDGNWHGLIGKQGDQYRKPGLWLCPNNSALHYDSYDSEGKRYGEPLNNFFEVKDQWIHITWVKQGIEYRFYRNGQLFATKPAPDSFYTNKHSSYWIGKIDTFWEGEIAEVAIWNYARSLDEIQTNLYQNLTGNESGLAGYWPFNEGAGSIAIDKTENSNQGKITGATWTQPTSLIPFEQKANYIKTALEFDGIDDFVEIYPENIPIGNEITVTFWAKGGDRLPKETAVIEALSENNYRLLNIHLPWSNGVVFFDCGTDIKQKAENFDRIEKAAFPYEYQEEWTHWAFVKNANTGEMSIYRNGILWHRGNNNKKPLPPTKIVQIGKYARSNSAHYQGSLAEFCIWNVAKSQAEIIAEIGTSFTGNEPGLLGYWPLNEGYEDTAMDKTPLRNHGKIRGAAWRQKTDNNQIIHFQSSLCFERYNNYIEIKDPFENDKEFTISLWVKTNALNDDAWHGFIGHQGDKYRKPGLWLMPDNSGLFYDSYDPEGRRYFGRFDNFFVTKDDWINITWVKIGKEYKFYRDGELFAIQPAPETFYCNKDTVYWIGRVDTFWVGQIAEVTIWNYARSGEEIKATMLDRLTGNELGLVGYWPLNEGSSDLAIDNSSRGNNGKIYFATWEQQNFIRPIGSSEDQNFIKSALIFDGKDDHIALPRMNFDYSQGLSIESWVYYNSFRKSSRIVDFGNGIEKDNIVFANSDTNNDLMLDIKQDATGQKLIAENVLETGRWIHLAATIDASGNGKLYKNGQEILSGKIHLPRNINRTLNYIARSNYTVDGYFDGELAEIRLWNRPRSKAELQSNMKRRLQGNEEGLVGYWALNEGRGLKALDKTDNANHGTVNGAVWLQPYQSEYVQPVLNFNGKGSFVEIPEHTNFTNAVTVSAWVKSKTPTWNEYGCLIAKRNPFSLHPEAGGRTFRFYIRCGVWKSVAFTPNIDITQWHHFAGSFDGQTIRLFIDGEEVAYTDAPGQLDNDNGRLYIGRDADAASRFFNGQIAEVQIWDKALTREELQNTMHRRLLGNEPGLIGYWPLNEGSGEKVLDRSKRGLHGKIIGASWDEQIFFSNEPVIYKHGWQLVQKLQPTEIKTDSFFGEEAAISGDWAIIGARKADFPRIQDAGTVYMLNLQNKMWHATQKLLPTDSRVGDQFGCAVSISGEWAIVGARKADALGIQDPGAAYMFRLENGTWQQKQKLQPEDLAPHSYFGNGVLIDGEWAIVGASHARSRGLQNTGAAYIFRLENGLWQLQQKLQPLDLGAKQCFGQVISMSGEWLVVGGGDRYTSASVKRPGGAYLYRLENGMWELKQKLISPQTGVNDLFGYSVAISGEQVIVGAVNTSVANLFSAGVVYTYQLEKGIWEIKQRLQSDNPQYCGFFGATVSISGNIAVVGSTRADSARVKDTGGAYIFQLKKGVWQLKQKLQAPDLHYESYFGFCTPIDGEWIFVTAAWENSPKSKRVGAVYAFEAQ